MPYGTTKISPVFNATVWLLSSMFISSFKIRIIIRISMWMLLKDAFYVYDHDVMVVEGRNRAHPLIILKVVIFFI